MASAAPILINAHVSLARAAGLDGLSYIRDVANGSQEFRPAPCGEVLCLVEEVRPMLKLRYGRSRCGSGEADRPEGETASNAEDFLATTKQQNAWFD